MPKILLTILLIPIAILHATEDRSEHDRFMDTIDSDCFLFDEPSKFPNSKTLMTNCTKLFKAEKNREALRWAMIWFARNQGKIEDGKCFRTGKPANDSTIKISKAKVINTGIENSCNFVFADLSQYCKKPSSKISKSVQAQWIDLCAEGGPTSRQIKIAANKLTCKTSGAYLTPGSQKLEAFGMNEANKDTLLKLNLKNERKIATALKSQQVAVLPIHHTSQDPSLCGIPRAPATAKGAKK